MRLIQPYNIKGKIRAPGSKSYLQRALAIAALAESETELLNAQWSSDSEATLGTIQQLGASTKFENDNIRIKPGKPVNRDGIVWNTGESGLSLRMFSCIAALYDFTITIDGEGTLVNRPVQPIIEALNSAGVKAFSKNGKLPISIHGPYPGGKIMVDGEFSSQIITGLLIALPLANSDSIIEVDNLQSIPYVDMTLAIIQHFGVRVHHDNYHTFQIKGNQSYKGTSYTIEGDWSAAANFLVAAAISGEIIIDGLEYVSMQADRAILDALKNCGAEVYCKEDQIRVCRKEMRPFQFDATHCPDLFPPLVVLAAACQGRSVIKGVNRLIYKESNRLVTLTETFQKLGVSMMAAGDELLINGTGRILGGTVASYHDHRIAMAAAIAAAIADGPIKIQEPEAVRKSHPMFYEELASCMEN